MPDEKLKFKIPTAYLTMKA